MGVKKFDSTIGYKGRPSSAELELIYDVEAITWLDVWCALPATDDEEE